MSNGELPVALVTGAGQGLGRAMALRLARTGYRVVVADRNAASATSVVGEIRGAGGHGLNVVVDVADESSVQAMVRTVAEKWQPPTVLVNNAAVFSALRMGPFTDISVAEWESVIRVNVTGVFLCTRALVPGMMDAGYGKIINISSATVWIGRPYYLHYVTSKAALIGFTRALATEVGPSGVRVNCVTPGSTETEVPRSTISAADRQAMAAMTPLRRSQTPTDLVGTVLFLASPDSDFITGQTINVDGGLAYH
jgi:3-oxoacyl-[acyl-carrier protein] reductase